MSALADPANGFRLRLSFAASRAYAHKGEDGESGLRRKYSAGYIYEVSVFHNNLHVAEYFLGIIGTGRLFFASPAHNPPKMGHHEKNNPKLLFKGKSG
jgi:hypothetical protein